MNPTKFIVIMLIMLSPFLFAFYYSEKKKSEEVKRLKQKLKDEQEIYMKLVKIRRRHRAKLRRKTKIMYRNNINF